MSTTFADANGTVRTFDRTERWDDRNANYPVSALLAGKAKPSAYDNVQDKRLNGLEAMATLHKAEIAQLMAAVFPGPGPAPTPPPAPIPVPPAPPSPSGDVVNGVTVLQDQLQEGECVGFAWSDYLASLPSPLAIVVEALGSNLESATAEKLYVLAQQKDGSPPDEQTGASTLGGAQATQALGFITAYHWATSISDITASIRAGLNVVTGINWYPNMMNIDANGFVHADGGASVGGHEIVWHGVAGDDSWVEGWNSWGPWGINGTGAFKIATTELDRLVFQESGDACVPVKV
jgi:hypothetical protein